MNGDECRICGQPGQRPGVHCANCGRIAPKSRSLRPVDQPSGNFPEIIKPLPVLGADEDEFLGEEIYYANHERGFLITDRRIKSRDGVYPIWSVNSVHRRTIRASASTHSKTGFLPIVVGLVAFSFLSKGCQKLTGEAIATGFALMIVGAFAVFVFEAGRHPTNRGRLTDDFQVVIETSSGKQFVFSSRRESEADAIERAVNESIANYQKH